MKKLLLIALLLLTPSLALADEAQWHEWGVDDTWTGRHQYYSTTKIVVGGTECIVLTATAFNGNMDGAGLACDPNGWGSGGTSTPTIHNGAIVTIGEKSKKHK